MANLENARLVAFRAVAQQLSFRKAAEELYLTQPAVSLQIKALEEDLGVLLFDRSGSRVALTRAGKLLLGYAERVHAMLGKAEQEIAAASGELAGQLALGASTTIAQYVLPRLLGEFLKSHPRVQPSLISGNTERIVEAVVARDIALGFIEGPSRSKDVKEEAFLADEIVLVVPAGHEWAERERIATKELAPVPMLMRERGSGTRHVVEMALERHGVKPASLNVAMELDSTEAIKSAVEVGLGVGFISKWAFAKDTRAGMSLKIVEVDDLRIKREFLMIFAPSPEPHGVVQEFRRFLIAHGARSQVHDSLRPSVPRAVLVADKRGK